MLTYEGIAGRKAGRCDERNIVVAPLLTCCDGDGKVTTTQTQQKKRDEYPSSTLKPTLTMENVHTLTTFELRQELKLQGHFGDNYAGEDITYRKLLAKAVGLIMEEQDLEEMRKHQEREHACLKSLGGTKNYHANGTGACERNEDDNIRAHSPLFSMTIDERLKQNKDARKAEALERSRQRQSEKNYFRSKQLQLKEHEKKGHLPNTQKTYYTNDNEHDSLSGIAQKEICDNAFRRTTSNECDNRESNCSTKTNKDKDPFVAKYRSRIGGKSA